MPSVGNAQMDKVKVSMAALKDKTAKLGAPKIEGKDPVSGKDVPALDFGTTKMNNFFDVVDEVVKESGGCPRRDIDPTFGPLVQIPQSLGQFGYL
jgi:hypothetical protein